MLKTFILYGLSFLFLSATFHVELYHQDHHDGYSICDINCDDEKHHSISHRCETCLNKKNRLIVQECINLSFNGLGTSLYSLNESCDDRTTLFILYIRPPPKLL